MRCLAFSCLSLWMAAVPSFAFAMELTGRTSIVISDSFLGDKLGKNVFPNDPAQADQQSIRLMLEDDNEFSTELEQDAVNHNNEWSIHIKTSRQYRYGVVDGQLTPFRSVDAFRQDNIVSEYMSHTWHEHSGKYSATKIGYEIDRLSYKHTYDRVSVTVGRQPIDWGRGRFWQPFNIFGAFAPIDLDTEYKSGVDALNIEWYPSDFSSMNLVYVEVPNQIDPIENPLTFDSNFDAASKNAMALHYRFTLFETVGSSLLLADVLDTRLIGLSFESDINGMGWRVESVLRYQQENLDKSRLSKNHHFTVAGIDYQFENSLLLSVEGYINTQGYNNRDDLIRYKNYSSLQSVLGLQPYLTSRVMGIGLANNITPLLNLSYSAFISPLKESRESHSYDVSSLHQLTALYSLTDESDLMLSVLLSNGEPVKDGNQQSEFGAVSNSMTVRWRMYF